MTGHTDVELINLYRNTKNGEAFAELMRRYQEKLFLVVTKRLGDADRAEEVVQTTFIRAFKYLDKFDPEKATFERWLINIGLNRMRTICKDMKKPDGSRKARDVDGKAGVASVSTPRGRTHSHGEEAERILTDEEWRHEIANFIHALSAKYRDPFILIYVKNLMYSEAGQQLGIPAPTLKGRVRVALRLIREAFPDVPRDLTAVLSHVDCGKLEKVA